MSRLNGVTGGTEKLQTPTTDSTTPTIEQLQRTLGPHEGIIQRDEDGNVINVIVGRTTEEEEDEILDGVVEPVQAKTNVVKALEVQAANVYKRQQHQAEGEKAFVRECIEKYGDDYQAMFRDIKLNTYQHTATQLRKKCEKYLQSLKTT